MLLLSVNSVTNYIFLLIRIDCGFVYTLTSVLIISLTLQIDTFSCWVWPSDIIKAHVKFSSAIFVGQKLLGIILLKLNKSIPRKSLRPISLSMFTIITIMNMCIQWITLLSIVIVFWRTKSEGSRQQPWCLDDVEQKYRISENWTLHMFGWLCCCIMLTIAYAYFLQLEWSLQPCSSRWRITLNHPECHYYASETVASKQD